MSLSEIQKERNEQCRERHELAVNRIRSMVTEETVEKAYVGYFQDVALFLLELENTRRKVASGEWGNYTLEQMRSLNEILYSDIPYISITKDTTESPPTIPAAFPLERNAYKIHPARITSEPPVHQQEILPLRDGFR